MKKQVFTTYASDRIYGLGLLYVLAIGLVALLTTHVEPIYAQTNAGTITVVGDGVVQVQPDVARVSIGVEVSDSQLANASAENKQLIQSVLAALKEQGVAEEDMQTTGFSVYADRYGFEGMVADNEVQYRVNNTVLVTIRDLDAVAAVIDAAVDAGANSIHGVSFQLEDTDGMEREARQKAIVDARDKAEALASLNGLRVGRIVSISEVIGGDGGFFDGRFVEAAEALGTAILPGELSRRVSIQVTYAIAPQETSAGSAVLPPAPLENGTYVGIYPEPITLTNGLFEGEPPVEGSVSRPTVTFLGKSAFGDLNGDQVEDAATLLVENSGGSGTFYYLAAVVNQNGELVNTATALVGDRSQIEALAIEDGTILLELISHGENDALCCPTQREVRTYELSEGQLINTSTEVLAQMNRELLNLVVAPATADCADAPDGQCLQVKTEPDADWALFAEEIEGFDYEPGYAYELLVEKISVADSSNNGSPARYSLVDVISKSTVNPENSALELEGTSWTLVGILVDNAVTTSEVDAMITAQFEEGRMSGSAGCNTYGVGYDANGSHLDLGVATTTMMACSEGQMIREQAFLLALEEVTGYVMQSNSLELTNDAGATVILLEREQ